MSRLSAAAMPASGTLVYMSPQQAMGYPRAWPMISIVWERRSMNY